MGGASVKSATGHQPSAAQPAAISCLLFRVGARLCALPVSAVVETMRPLPVEPFAQAPLGVQGMAIIRGAPLPVLALAALLDGHSDKPARFITVKIADRQIALAVGAVMGVESIAAVSLQQLPPLLGVANTEAVQAIGAIDTQLLLLLNAARLVESTTAAMAEPQP
jgi:purine-binding chemotaxis protein CheW